MFVIVYFISFTTLLQRCYNAATATKDGSEIYVGELLKLA